MPRIARVVIPGCPHHVTQRGVRSMPVFTADGDRQTYLDLVARQAERFGVKFLSYCLMTNHVHFVAVPRAQDSLARAIGEAHRRYTRAVNRRDGVRGHLFQERFYSCPLDGRHTLAAVRYVEQNPVRAGLSEQAWEYAHSSAAFHAGLRRDDPLVRRGYIDCEVGDWREFLRAAPADIDAVRAMTRRGRPCGDAGFVERMEKETGRRLRPLPVGRPYKEGRNGV